MEGKIAIYGYGSLLVDAGPDLQPLIIERIPHPSPRPVEYARLSRSRGNAPAVAFFDRGGIVTGQILVLDLPDTEEAREKVAHSLWLREGRPPRAAIRTMSAAGIKTVFYCDLEPTIPNPTPRLLADFAIESVAKCAEAGVPSRNGIRYLRDCLEVGVVTPLSHAYADAILAKLKAKDLKEAEEIALARLEKK
ncbi:MAG: hypothetical protein K6U03_05355 [Firmicutes bacterium]|nr:hypothetical protein [Bacillota bacterium]